MSEDGVLFHHHPLGLRQGPPLEEDGIRSPDLADVVQGRRQEDQVLKVGNDAMAGGQGGRIVGHPHGVPRRFAVALVGHEMKATQHGRFLVLACVLRSARHAGGLARLR